ncbi:hypothetical protein HBA53_00465 [Rhodococcus pyridinivorans]|uniref:hypothetical protein n=1 Tax=Rhodococcus pyridinivorans TaxID=103816 RepID=UPI001C303B15|nr:hypothetical protein [Rhodococcus pyridinivorans]QXF79747.1 hypothetical protein HBA53_00465 [Rhodococcus pyridinivorans]
MKLIRKWRSRDIPTPIPALPLAGPRDLTALTQDENRERRRGRLPVHYTGTFSLVDEIEAVLAPLAHHPEVNRYPTVVTDLTAAVHQLRLDVEKLLVLRDARRRIADLPYENRGRARDILLAAWQRPTPPVTDPGVDWADILTAHVAPITEPLRDYLDRATSPGQTSGGISISEHLEDSLRELDQTVLRLSRALDQTEQLRLARVGTAAATNAELRRLNPTRAELEALGLV